MITATLSGLTFSTDYDAVYSIESLDGWFGSSPVRDTVDARPNSDGAFEELRFHRAARPITLAGKVHASGDGFGEWRELAAVLGSGRPDILTVDDGSVSLSSVVRPVGSGLSLSPMVNGMANYVLSVVAYDPVKYSAPVVSVASAPSVGGGLQYNLHAAGVLEYGSNGELGRVSVTNSGTAKTYPVVTVSGGLAGGFTVSRLDTGERVQYERVVTDGSTVVMDFRTGSVLVDGVSDASASLTIADFFGVEPGTTVDVQFTPIGTVSGAPTMTVELSSGWW